jgi:hypothetical protein
MSVSRAPSRSYEPLAIRICKAAHTIMDGERSQWATVANLSQVLKVKDEEMLSRAIGETVALKRSGHSNAPPRTSIVKTAKK